MGANVTDTGSGGVKCTGLWIVLQGCGTIRPDIWVGEMVPDAPGGPDPQGLPPEGGPSDEGSIDMVTIQWGVIISTHGGGYAGGRSGDNRDLHHSLSEHNFPIYRNSSDIGDVSDIRAEPGVTCPKEVVATGGPGLGGLRRAARVVTGMKNEDTREYREEEENGG